VALNGYTETELTMTQPTHIQANTGLCQYEPPDSWFDPTRIRTSLAICTNCAVRQACAQSALDMDETDGIWGGVKLPGLRKPAKLEEARDRLRDVIQRLQHAPLEQRRHTLRMREAIHFAATAPDERRRAARERRAAEIRAALERTERIGA
jgi:WhiB family transcriptional regulator, redox-sensing transcriptional regulator